MKTMLRIHPPIWIIYCFMVAGVTFYNRGMETAAISSAEVRGEIKAIITYASPEDSIRALSEYKL